jgi:hypothetical protein
MPLEVQLHSGDCQLGAEQEQRIRLQLRALEGRLVHFSEPVARLVLRQQGEQRRIYVDLRIELGPKGGELISHQSAETPEHAVRLAIEDAERELERRLSSQRGEATFGVPSRRRPNQARPHPLEKGEETEELEDTGASAEVDLDE